MEGNRCATTSVLSRLAESRLAEPWLVSTVPLRSDCVALTTSVEPCSCPGDGDDSQRRMISATIIAPGTNCPFGY
jgi:hypothetical protein